MSVIIKGMKMPKSCGDCPLNSCFCTRGFGDFVEQELYSKRAEDCPLVEVPRRGKWKCEDEYEYGENAWRCSVCGEPYILIEGTPKENLYNFCPNCGADMREEEK